MPGILVSHAPAQVIPFRQSRRRSGLVALLAAAILVGAAFTGGYFAGHGGGMHVVREASLASAGSGRAFASLQVGKRFGSGNWPIEMTVRGLPQQPNERAYYLLLLWRDGKPAGVCGHVGPALVNDADDAERHPHPFDAHAVRPIPASSNGSDRIGAFAGPAECDRQ